MKQIGLPASLEARTEIRAEATVLYRVEDGAKVRRAIGPLSNLRSFVSANPGEFVLTVTF